MDCDELEKYIPDYLAGGKDTPLGKNLEAHLNQCPNCRKEVEEMNHIWAEMGKVPEEKPGVELEQKFNVMLKAEDAKVNPDKHKESVYQKITGLFSRIWPQRPLIQFSMVAAIFAIGIFIGSSTRMSQEAHFEEVARIEDKVQKLNQLVMLTLLQQDSPSDRLKGLNLAYSIDAPNEKVIDALINTLNEDPSVNLRLAAVDVLNEFSGHKSIKSKLLSSLLKQSSPIIQVGLIELVVAMGDKNAASVFNEMLKSRTLDKTVKKRLLIGLNRLQASPA